jgi:DNA-directed RNA polymerase specialized sigma24 family protein
VPEEPSGDFQTTRWTIVAQAGGASAGGAGGETQLANRRVALDILLRSYYPPLRRFLVTRYNHSSEAADDILQGFIASSILEKNLLHAADQTKGRFRTFLLTALQRYAVNEWRAARTQRRGGGKIAAMDDVLEPADNPARDQFDMDWAKHVIGQAVQRVETECAQSNRPDVWGVFQARVLGPTLQEQEAPSYAELVDKFGFKSPAHASNVLVTGKRMFIRTLRDVVAEYGGSEDAIEEEILDLHRILAGGIPS